MNTRSRTRPLYVETRIRTGLDELWRRTQDPAQHQRWDLRFTHISYLDGGDEDGVPRRFTYGVRVLPGLLVSGTGVAAGERHRADGTRTSALRFASPHPLSFLKEGRGYWRYIPQDDGTVRFLTGYDYAPRWGVPGALADRHVLRPLMGWATAWSFDRLRLWCEHGVTPARGLARALTETGARLLAVTGTAATAATYGTPLLALLGTALTAAAAVLLPPLPGTPAARRCLRRAPDRAPERNPGPDPGLNTGQNPGGAPEQSRGPAPDAPDASAARPPALLDRLEHP